MKKAVAHDLCATAPSMQGKRRLSEQGGLAELVEQQVRFHDALLVRECEATREPMST